MHVDKRMSPANCPVSIQVQNGSFSRRAAGGSAETKIGAAGRLAGGPGPTGPVFESAHTPRTVVDDPALTSAPPCESEFLLQAACTSKYVEDVRLCSSFPR
jgi:hypothetical protein